jgi:Family of unknown function (DUF6165)
MSTNSCSVQISIGELYDKFSILHIKRQKITDKTKLEHIYNEICLLSTELNKLPFFCKDLFDKLLNINAQLWQIEDDIRIKEKNNEFDSDFIELARSVYITNDKRFEIKNEINSKHNSNIFEVKSYEKYC